jgi:hypothetical protein
MPLQSIDELVTILKIKFGEGQVEKFRAELKTRKQRSGETLQSLHFDTQRIANKAYPGVRNETADTWLMLSATIWRKTQQSGVHARLITTMN